MTINMPQTHTCTSTCTQHLLWMEGKERGYRHEIRNSAAKLSHFYLVLRKRVNLVLWKQTACILQTISICCSPCLALSFLPTSSFTISYMCNKPAHSSTPDKHLGASGRLDEWRWWLMYVVCHCNNKRDEENYCQCNHILIVTNELWTRLNDDGAYN